MLALSAFAAGLTARSGPINMGITSISQRASGAYAWDAARGLYGPGTLFQSAIKEPYRAHFSSTFAFSVSRESSQHHL